jgi:hypothetical protein
MVTQLGWEPLQVRRVKIRLLLLFIPILDGSWEKGVLVNILPG